MRIRFDAKNLVSITETMYYCKSNIQEYNTLCLSFGINRKKKKKIKTYFLHNNGGKWTASLALRWRNDFEIISNCASNLSLETEKVFVDFLYRDSKTCSFPMTTIIVVLQ